MDPRIKLWLLYNSSCYSFNSDGNSKYSNCLCLSCFTCCWKRTWSYMGAMCYVSFPSRQFWICLWFYADGFDTYFVSLYMWKRFTEFGLFRFLNQPMFEYNQEYGFSIMNYVMSGLCTFLLLAPIACVIRERQMRNLSSIGCDWACSKKTNEVSPQNEMTSATTEWMQ